MRAPHLTKEAWRPHPSLGTRDTDVRSGATFSGLGSALNPKAGAGSRTINEDSGGLHGKGMPPVDDRSYLVDHMPW